MRKAGLEPARLAALEPKSSASTSSATLARAHCARPRRPCATAGGRSFAMDRSLRGDAVGEIDLQDDGGPGVPVAPYFPGRGRLPQRAPLPEHRVHFLPALADQHASRDEV